MIFSLDLGTKTGWAISLPNSSHVVSGVNNFANTRYEGGGMRYLRFRHWLEEIYKDYPFGKVVYEEVRRHLSTDAAHVHGGLLAHLTSWCEEREVPYMGVPVGTIKKHATGLGNASKAAVMAAMTAAGHRPKDDNEADALALLRWAVDPQAGGLILPNTVVLKNHS
jgi:Holliday junction resolvasome RuvABC endonuclease subunit